MDPGLLISVEAAVKSNRANFISIFEIEDDHTENGLKAFFSDPTLTRQCILKLKENGFKVSQVGKISLSVQGPVSLFEKKFNVKIVQTDYGLTCEGGDRFGYIDTRNTAYSDLLAGIAFSPKTVFQSSNLSEDIPDSERIWVHEIPKKLGIRKSKAELMGAGLNTRINVAIVDSGLHFHQYLKEYSPKDVENISVQSPWDQNYVDRLIGDLKELSDMYRSAVSLYNSINSLAKYSPSTDVDDLPDIVKQQFHNLRLLVIDVLPDWIATDLKRLNNISGLVDSLELAIRRWANTLIQLNKIQNIDDPANHGTKVVATLLEFVRDMNTRIRVVKTGYFDVFVNYQSAIDQLLRWGDRPVVVNCSFGTGIPKATTREPISKLPSRDGTPTISPIYELYKRTVESLVAQGITVVFIAGNFKSKHPDEYLIEPQWPFVISVGGAYRLSTSPAFIYSDDSHGYQSEIFPNRIVPDISGINGPKGFSMTRFPKVPDGWEPKNGTSFAAPQVTGACVFIKKVFPSATPAQIKEILIRTAQPMGSGKSTQGVEMTTLRHRLSNGDEIAPGVLDIDLSVTAAKFAHLITLRDRGEVDIKFAVQKAKAWLARPGVGN